MHVQGEQSIELYKELFTGLGKRITAIELAEDSLPKSNGL